MRIDFHRGAVVDLEQSIDWYAVRSTKAARDFAIAFERALDELAASPHRCATIATGLRGYSLKRFPFQIVFRDEPSRIYILAIAHVKRDPSYWQLRVDN